MKKETKAQRVERIKIEKDGLDVLSDIYRYARTGEAVDPEDIDRFKWYGLYTQNRNLQAEDDETLYFMLRVKLPHARLDLGQLTRVADISKEYARSTADFTTRQDLQFHYIRVQDLPLIFEKLKEVGLSTLYAAGDVPRNIVTCAVNGIDPEQTCDVTSLVDQVNSYFYANKELSNLPRKYKVGINGCSKHCLCHEIQDLSFTATKIDNEQILFDVSVGGGLSSNKRIASHIGYVSADQVLETTKAVSEIYRDYGNRQSRTKARLGHLIEEWGLDTFINALHKNVSFKLQKHPVQDFTPYQKREHFGAHASLVGGNSFLGCAVSSGSIQADGLHALADIMKKFGAGTIKTTTTQNFVITDVPNANVNAITQALKEVNIDVNPSVFKARTLACTGVNFCKFAISETKGLANNLIAHLEKTFPNFHEPISFSINGCPHSCAHPHIVDIGLLGCKVKRKDDTSAVAGFELILGGYLEGDKSNFGIKTGIKFVEKDAIKTVEGLLYEYKNSQYTNFHDFACNFSNNPIKGSPDV